MKSQIQIHKRKKFKWSANHHHLRKNTNNWPERLGFQFDWAPRRQNCWRAQNSGSLEKMLLKIFVNKLYQLRGVPDTAKSKKIKFKKSGNYVEVFYSAESKILTSDTNISAKSKPYSKIIELVNQRPRWVVLAKTK